MPWNEDGTRKAFYKKSGFTPYTKGDWSSPFMHDAKNEDGTWKTDKHGQSHKESYEKYEERKKIKTKERNKRKESSTTQPFIGRKV